MPGTILTELHGNRVGLDEVGNLVLNPETGFPQTAVGIVGPGIPIKMTISAAAGASNICNVTFQLQDVAGASVSRITDFDLYLSDASTGIGLTATTPSGGIAAVAANGTIIGVYTTSKAVRAQFNATGKFVLAITDSAKTLFYPVGALPGRAVVVGPQLITANYG